jgi:hypothetical protein
MNSCILYTKSDETWVFKSATESGVKHDNQIWLPISLPYLVIKTVTTFGHQNANHIWSPTPGPHEVFTSRTTFGGKTVTVFGHQNGNRNKQFFVVLKTVLE